MTAKRRDRPSSLSKIQYAEWSGVVSFGTAPS